MQIETLQIFCDLAELKNFSHTAEKNMLSQSAVSQQIAQLERSFNTTLINRHRKSFGLTAAGELFYNTAKDIINRYETFSSSLNFLKNSSKSKISIAAIYSIGMHSLQDYIKKFMVLKPAVHLDIDYLSSAEIYSRLLQGRIDVGLVAEPSKNSELQIYNFITEPLVCVCSRQHPYSCKSEIDVCMMQYQPFIGFSRNLPTRDLLDRLLIRYNVAVNPVMEFDNVETIKRVVEINSGISILPLTTIKNELANGTLCAIKFADEKLTRQTAVLVRKNRAMNENLKTFIDLLTAE